MQEPGMGVWWQVIDRSGMNVDPSYKKIPGEIKFLLGLPDIEALSIGISNR